MSTRQVHVLGIVSLLIVSVLYYAGIDVVNTLSPQGCRMSWMSPSYVLQTGFDRSWSPLDGRYTLWLYREVGWQGNELNGAPVIFIPGNAGSSHQVRSIASSAARQFYSAPYDIAFEFRGKSLKPLDFFAVEFNEDLSAFHGTTLDAQTSYTSRAIDYILSLYPAGTPMIVLGHSMGGIVATSLLPHENIAAIITMSTPHSLPPARFDRHMDSIYNRNRETLLENKTPILSLCGGATDLMIPSESCILPAANTDQNGQTPYRRTVFSSALEGSWTGVGHREMVWCHQVRWRVARAALELGAANSVNARGDILDTWLRDGHILPPGYTSTSSNFNKLRSGDYTLLPANLHLTVRNPTGSHVYLLPIVPNPATIGKTYRKMILYLSQGTIPPTSPQNALPLRASVLICHGLNTCRPLEATALKLIPNAFPGRPFPIPDEGSDESEGVVVFEASVPVEDDTQIAVKMENGDGRGWIVAGFVPSESVVNPASSIAPFISHVSISLEGTSVLGHSIHLPNWLSNALVVYRIVPVFASHCAEPLLSPLLQHSSHPSETHYYPLTLSRLLLIHTHASAPFIDSSSTHGLNLTIYSSGESSCSLSGIDITVDWWGTLGRWGVRLGASAVSWAIGIVALILCDTSRTAETCGTVPPVLDSLSKFIRTRLVKLLLLVYAISLLPLPSWLWLGTKGEYLLGAMGPLTVLVSTGFVSVSWWLIVLLKSPLSFFSRFTASPRDQPAPGRRTNILTSLALICLLIFVLVPWQVGFLGCWIFHLYTCATYRPTPNEAPTPAAIPLIIITDDDTPDEAAINVDALPPPPPTPSQHPNSRCFYSEDVHNEREHLLLLMTWLLPLAAPILAVWVRTLLTAGFTTPFDGDHNFLRVLPFLMLVDPGWGFNWLRARSGRIPAKASWRLLVIAFVAFVFGPRQTYAVFEAASGSLGLGVLLDIVLSR